MEQGTKHRIVVCWGLSMSLNRKMLDDFKVACFARLECELLTTPTLFFESRHSFFSKVEALNFKKNVEC